MTKFESTKKKLIKVLEPLGDLKEILDKKKSQEKLTVETRIDEYKKDLAKITAKKIIFESKGKAKEVSELIKEEKKILKMLTSEREQLNLLDDFIESVGQEEFKELGLQVLNSKEFKEYSKEHINAIVSINNRLKEIELEKEALRLKYQEEERELDHRKKSISNYNDMLTTLKFAVKVSGALPYKKCISAGDKDLITMCINDEVVFNPEEQEQEKVYMLTFTNDTEIANGRERSRMDIAFLEGKI